MGLLFAVVLLAGGMLGAADWIAAKRTAATSWTLSLQPFQGLIGVVLLVCGLWGVLNLILHGVGWFSVAALWALVFLLSVLTSLSLGFLLSYPILQKHVLKSEKAASVGAGLVERLTLYRAPLGLSAIGVALLTLYVSISSGRLI